MTVKELIDHLSELDQDAEVTLAEASLHGGMIYGEKSIKEVLPIFETQPSLGYLVIA